MSSTIDDMVQGHRDAITVKRIYGDPYEKNGLTIIPAAKVMGGGGGGSGQAPDGSGEALGTGFGLVGKPVGAFVIRGDDVQWRPAIDVNRIIVGAFIVAALGIILGRR